MRLLLILLLVSQSLQAQVMVRGATTLRTGPVTTQDKVEFRLELPTMEEAMVMPVRLRVDNPAMSAAYSTLAPPRTCVSMGSKQFICEAFLPSDIVTRLNVPGRHLLYSYTFDGRCCESAPSDPWTVTTPSKP